MIELLSNELKEGDMIVLDGLTKVYDGAEVVVNSKTELLELKYLICCIKIMTSCSLYKRPVLQLYLVL